MNWGIQPGSGGKVLLSCEEIAAADLMRGFLGLPVHLRPYKVWESMVTLDLVRKHNPSGSARFVDLGSRHGVLLPWLARLGYQHLFGCDLNYPFPPIRTWLKTGHVYSALQTATWILNRRLQLSRQDLCRTNYASGSFDLVSSLSVIEHVPDPEAAIAEMRRLLKPSGLAAISTDYWQTPIVTDGKHTCGQPMRIYDRETIGTGLIQLAERQGLELCGPVDFRCAQPLVSFMGVEYTFIVLLFRVSH